MHRNVLATALVLAGCAAPDPGNSYAVSSPDEIEGSADSISGRDLISFDCQSDWYFEGSSENRSFGHEGELRYESTFALETWSTSSARTIKVVSGMYRIHHDEWIHVAIDDSYEIFADLHFALFVRSANSAWKRVSVRLALPGSKTLRMDLFRTIQLEGGPGHMLFRGTPSNLGVDSSNDLSEFSDSAFTIKLPELAAIRSVGTSKMSELEFAVVPLNLTTYLPFDDLEGEYDFGLAVTCGRGDPQGCRSFGSELACDLPTKF
jgi:uncharacterized protein YaiE (UPF0345 family)